MSAVTKTSRSEMDFAPQKADENDQFELPALEFDFIEVDNTNQDDIPAEEEEVEFEFPLFGSGSSATTNAKEEEDRGRKDIKKISIREPSVERIIQSRPDSYYFTYNDATYKARIAEVAISGEQIIQASQEVIPDAHPWRVLDLVKHNEEIERLKQTQKKRKGQRPGKRKREGIIKSRERKAERLKVQKAQDREAKKKLMKKIHHKRGGKKNKKKAATSAPATRPKYKTEG